MEAGPAQGILATEPTKFREPKKYFLGAQRSKPTFSTKQTFKTTYVDY